MDLRGLGQDPVEVEQPGRDLVRQAEQVLGVGRGNPGSLGRA
jgi:hypothetical protein